MTTTTITREQWLHAAADALRPLFDNIENARLPKHFDISVGFPGGGSARRRIGECWSKSASAAGRHQVFISPVLGEPEQVLSTLLHEMIHVADDNKSGHKGEFRRIAKALGFEAPMTSTPAGDELKATLKAIAKTLKTEHGAYPHKALTIGASKGIKNWHKVYCSDCGWYCRMNSKHFDEGLGAPKCPYGCEDGSVCCDTL